MDLMEQIRLEATKYAAEFENACQSRDEDCGKIAPAFQSGAQALLNLLGRSATSEGHPPRVWIHTLDRKSVVPVHALIHFEPEHEHHEYLSRQEHEALRAADMLEINKLRAEARLHNGIVEQLQRAQKALLDEKEKQYIAAVKGRQDFREALSQEREARKGDSAELEKIREDLDHENWRLEKALKVRWNDLVAEREKNARLTAALEKIAKIGPRNGSNIEFCIATAALAEAKK